MRRRTAVLLAVSALVAGVVSAVATTPAAATPASRATGPAASHRGGHQGISARRLSGGPHPTLNGAVTLPAEARTPNLDPRLGLPTQQRSTEVRVEGEPRAAAAAIRRLGGRVLASADGVVTGLVPHEALTGLAGAAGVARVAPIIPAVPAALPDEVSASGASSWYAALQTGANVSIGIVDAGFAGISSGASPALPLALTGTAVVYPAGQDHCANDQASNHGTAVTEIVHQMAPDATIYLYCVDDNVGFTASEQQIVAVTTPQKIRVVNSSLGFPGDGRGDGTGGLNSTPAAVKDARLHGVLWVQSAGNTGEDHWSGSLVDANHDNLIDLDTTNFEVDNIGIDPSGRADIVMRYDQWPTSPSTVGLIYQQFDGTNGNPIGRVFNLPHSANTEPVVDLCFVPGGGSGCAAMPSPDSTGLVWLAVGISSGTSTPRAHYDLSYEGSVPVPNGLSCGNATCTTVLQRAAQGSISDPASSPFAVAVGAVDVTNSTTSPCDTTSNGITAGGYGLESYSSQGPTIDGRTKPDITGFDAVQNDFESPRFCGTSASAPNVAGAAALVAGQNPTWDAAQIQNFLEQRANGGVPSNPPTNQGGHGVLTLGDPATTTLPTPAGYAPLASPLRVLDTRPSKGGKGPFGSGTIRPLSFAGKVPADATAVAINLTGTDTSSATYLSLFPGGSAWPHTSNLNLSQTDKTAAVFAVVTLGTNQTINIRNDQGTVNVLVDLLGSFTPTATGRYTSITTHRVLDTRKTNQRLTSGKSVTVNPALPPGATAAVVNVTAAGASGAGYLSAAPGCTRSSSTLNYTKNPRANLAVVGLSGGRFCVLDEVAAVDVVVDVVGYISGSGASYVALPAPVRILDSRTGNGNTVNRSPRAFAPGEQRSETGRGIFDVPYNATALLVGVVEASTTSSGYLNVFPAGTSATGNSTLNFSPGRVVPNAAVAGVGSGAYGVYNSGGTTHVAVDLVGYFVP